jgi:hypothetical protein
LPDAISSAVRTAVPLGESIFVSRCDSMISAKGKNFAASAAIREPITDPSEKLGMITTATPAASARGAISAIFSADQPLVATSAGIPRAMASRTIFSLASRVVASTTRSTPAMSAGSLADPSTVVTSKSGASSITERMILPSLPDPPARATRVMDPV